MDTPARDRRFTAQRDVREERLRLAEEARAVSLGAGAAGGRATDGLRVRYSALADDGALPDDARRAALLLSVAEGHLEEDDGDRALRAAEDALPLFRAAGDQAGVADAQRLVVSAKVSQGALADGRAVATRELAAFRQSGDRRGQGVMTLALASVALEEGQVAESLQLVTEARAHLDAGGDAKMQASAALLLVSAQLAAEMPQSAVRSGAAAVPLLQGAGDARGEARAWHLLARSHIAAGFADEALDAASAALRIYRELACQRAEGHVLEELAYIHLRRRRPQEAVRLAQQARSLFGQLGYARGEQLALGTLVNAHLESGEVSWAASLAQDAQQAFRRSSERHAEAAVWGDAMVQVHLARGSPEDARGAARTALDLFRGLGDRRREAQTLDNLASLHLMSRELEDAAAVAREAAALYTALADARGQAALQYRLSALQHQRGDHAEGLRLAASSRSLFRQAGARTSETAALLAECFAQHLLGEDRVASTLAAEAVTKAQEALDSRGEAAAWLSCAALELGNPSGVDIEQAAKAAASAEALLRKRGQTASVDDDRLLGDALHLLTLARFHGGELEAALRTANEALVLFRRVGDRVGEAESLRMAACIELAVLLGQMRAPQDIGSKSRRAIERLQASALRSAEQAVEIIRALPLDSRPLLPGALHVLAQVFNACSLGEEALAAATEAADLFREIGDKEKEANSLVVLADASVIRGDRKQATDAANQAAAIFHELGDQSGEAWARNVLRGAGADIAGYLPDVPAVGAFTSAVDLRPDVKGMALEDALRIARETAILAVGNEEDVDMDSPLMEIGLDSLAAINFREQLIKNSGLTVPTSLVFDYPSLQSIAQHMVETSLEVARKQPVAH